MLNRFATQSCQRWLQQQQTAKMSTKTTPGIERLLKKKKVVPENPEIVARREERKKQQREQLLSEATKHLPSFTATVKQTKPDLFPLIRDRVDVMQVNIGKVCNLSCIHCHVESGPTKLRENMNQETVDRMLAVLKSTPSVHTVDITGGAPEMNPHFKQVVKESRDLGKTVIDRCNLTVLFLDGMEDMPKFLADQQVQVVASLPCYTVENVDKQRGKGVFNESVEALRILNDLGYGRTPELPLYLVYNPTGASLPGDQQQLEKSYKEELKRNLDIDFTALFTITNMPIKRFADDLFIQGEYINYMQTLVESFNPSAIEPLMCRNIVNIAWDGQIYDCDFNQALQLNTIKPNSTTSSTLWNIDSFDQLNSARIRTGMHCYGCTAGAGSSCSGALDVE